MSSALDLLAKSAADQEPAWDDARADRVFATTLVRREKSCARARLVRRSLAVGGAIAVVVFVLLRGAGASTTNQSTSSANATSETPTSIQEAPQPPAILATHGDLLGANGDGGYGRD